MTPAELLARVRNGFPRSKGKPKLTPERQEVLLELIRQGAPLRIAAEKVGIHRATFYAWMEKGREASTGKYAEFAAAVEEAQAHAEVTLTLQMRAHATEPGSAGFQATAWMLERRFPERWARHQIVEARHSGPDGEPLPQARVSVELSGLSLAELHALANEPDDGPSTGTTDETETDQ